MKKSLLLLPLFLWTAFPSFSEDTFYYNGLQYSHTSGTTCSVARNAGISGVVSIPRFAVRTWTDSKGDHSEQYEVVSISNNAFSECANLTKAILPNSIESISFRAFYKCSSLEEINIPENVKVLNEKVLSDCKSLKSIKLPEALITIGQEALAGCTGLTSITIPSSVTTIGMEAFWGCTGLTSITIPSSVYSIGSAAFYGCSGLTEVVYNATNASIDSPSFGYSLFPSGISKFIIGNAVEDVPRYLFDGVTGLQEVVFNAENCTSSITFPSTITKLTFGDSVTRIPGGAFKGCTGLTNITFPNSVTDISTGAFSGCTGLTKVDIPPSVVYIGWYLFEDCTGLTEVNFIDPENSALQQIGNSAFKDCSNLTAMCVPNQATEICSYAFSGCKNLKEVIIGKSVTDIGDDVFYNCSSLMKIAHPDNITSKISDFGYTIPYPANEVEIEDNYVYGPGKSAIYFAPLRLEGIYNMPTTVKSVAQYAFYGCDKLTAIKTTSIDNWLNIKFGNATANPLYYVKKLIIGDEIISNLDIPLGTKRINAYSFINCESLQYVTVPSGVESAGDEPFSGCTNLKRITFNTRSDFLLLNYDSQKSKLTYNNSAIIYFKEHPIPDDGKELTLPEDMTWIPDYAFYGDLSLSKVILPSRILGIGKYAFAKCTNLQEIYLPNSITEIGKGAFYGCTSLKSITLPTGLKEISDSTFSECENLECDIIIPDKVTKVGANSFACCRKITRVSLPYGIEQICDSAFWGDWKLEAVIVDNVPETHNQAMQNIERYDIFSANDAPSRIGIEAFFACWSLKSVTIPASISTIDKNIFGWCNAITEIRSLNPIPPVVDESAFSSVNKSTCVLKVPAGSVDQYRNADVWKYFANIIADVTAIDEVGSDNCIIKTENGSIIIEEAETTAEVYTISGILMYRGNEGRIDGLSQGIYIIKLGNRSIKLFVP